MGKDGQTVDSPSTFSPARLEADKSRLPRADAALESRSTRSTRCSWCRWRTKRASGAACAITARRRKRPLPGRFRRSWSKAWASSRERGAQVFGDDADETFQAWYIADYIEQVAAAGKAEYALPLYVNAALRDPFHPGHAPSYESGAPTDNNIDLWKIAAPSISVIAPDIYMPEYAKYMKSIELYKRKNNPLLIPETGNAAVYAHYVYAAIGQGAIGWAPFGLDLTPLQQSNRGAGGDGGRCAEALCAAICAAGADCPQAGQGQPGRQGARRKRRPRAAHADTRLRPLDGRCCNTECPPSATGCSPRATRRPMAAW